MTAPPVLPQVYRISSGLSSRPWPYFAGGAGLVALAVFGFVTSLSARTGPLQLHLSSTLPMIIAVGLFGAGFRMARSPREVVLSPEGLRVKSRGGEKVLGWDQVAWADVQTQAITNQKVLAIRGNDGKVLLTLSSSLEPFDQLVADVQGRLTSNPSPAASDVRWRKARRTAKALIVAAVLAAAGSVWTGWMAYDTRRSDELMRTQAVDGQAVIVRKFVAPDGHTRRIEYRVAGAGDAAKLHNVEVNEVLWGFLREGARVPVKTVPGHPEIARLVVGEVRDDFLEPSPMTSGLLSLGLLIMSGLFAAGAVLGFKGIDISTDPVTGRLKLNRLPK